MDDLKVAAWAAYEARAGKTPEEKAAYERGREDGADRFMAGVDWVLNGGMTDRSAQVKYVEDSGLRGQAMIRADERKRIADLLEEQENECIGELIQSEYDEDTDEWKIVRYFKASSYVRGLE